MSETLTREEALRRLVVGGAMVALPGLAPALAWAASEARDPRLKDTLVISNWPLYIDVDEKTKKRPTLELFQRRYGVKVKYIEDINDNATFFGKIQGALSRGQSTGRDIVVLTDDVGFPALMIERGWAERLVKRVIKYLQPALRHPSFDPNRDYSLPWQSGMTGIGYNPKLTGRPVTSVGQLLDDPRLKGRVTLLTEMADTVGLVMLDNGDNPEKVTDTAFERAIKRIERAVKSGQIRKFTGNDYAPLLAKGDIAAALAWSGDIVQLQADNPGLRWTLPKAGGMIWTDNMLIPKGGDAYTASVFMNFVYDPKVQARIEAYVKYVSPVAAARNVLLKSDPSIAKNVLIFPTKEMLRKVHIFDAKAVLNRDYREKWQKLLGA
ncbi:MAG: ABC transporter substrate-binding protein [Thermoleophilia bacterium]